MFKQLPQISTRNRNSQQFSGWNQRHWKLGFHVINHWVIFHSLFYMILVSNKQLVFTACSSHPFAVHKLSAGHFRTTSATRHSKTPVFYMEDVNLALTHSLSIFGILFILHSQTSQSSFSASYFHQQMWFSFGASEQQQSNTDKMSLKAQHMQTSISLSFFKGHPLKISNLIYKSFSVIIFKTDAEYFWRVM